MKMHQKGFTLLELMTAMIAIAILASIASSFYSRYMEQAQLQEASHLTRSLTPIIFSNLKQDRCTSLINSNSIIGKYGQATITGAPITSSLDDKACYLGCSVSFKFNDSDISNNLKGKKIKLDLLTTGDFIIDKQATETTLSSDYHSMFKTPDDTVVSQFCAPLNPQADSLNPSVIVNNSLTFQKASQFKNAQDYKRSVVKNISDYQRHWISEANNSSAIWTFPIAIRDSQLTDTGESGFSLTDVSVVLTPSVIISSTQPSILFDRISLIVGYANGSPYVTSEMAINPNSQRLADVFNEIKFTIFNEANQLYSVIYPTDGSPPTYVGKYDYRYDKSKKMMVEFIRK